MPTHTRRGIKRVLVMLTVIWSIYPLFMYPGEQRNRAIDLYNISRELCYNSGSTPPNDLQSCVRNAESTFEQTYKPWMLFPYLQENWFVVVAAILLPPVFAYWLILGTYAVMMWICHGFRRDVV